MSDEQGTEHAVIIHFQYGSIDLTNLFAVEDDLIDAVGAAGVGECDGHEIAIDGSDGYFYLYGPNADELFAAIRPIIAATDKIKSPEIVLRYGRADDPNAVEKHVDLGAAGGTQQ